MSSLRLSSVKYNERAGSPREWDVEFSLGQINLLVGKNATGKTRSLNLIYGLAGLLSSPKLSFSNGCYDVKFSEIQSGQIYQYEVDVVGGKIIKERLKIDDDIYLDRSENKAEINTNNDNVYGMALFSPPDDQVAAVLRRDKIQHPFFEVLHSWSESTRRYQFGSPLGKDNFLSVKSDEIPFDDKDEKQVVALFRKASKEFPKLENLVIQDMATLGYDIDSIEVAAPQDFKLLGHELSAIAIKEEGLDRLIDQGAISQGMFRALSILIQVNYSQLSHRASCILIDDIGEGLDFERSTALIKLLCDKANNSSFQLVMTTNDRFVMNHVSLKNWVVLQRKGGHVIAKTYENSKKLFEKFRFTGLSNFSFFESDYLNQSTSQKD